MKYPIEVRAQHIIEDRAKAPAGSAAPPGAYAQIRAAGRRTMEIICRQRRRHLQCPARRARRRRKGTGAAVPAGAPTTCSPRSTISPRLIIQPGETVVSMCTGGGGCGRAEEAVDLVSASPRMSPRPKCRAGRAEAVYRVCPPRRLHCRQAATGRPVPGRSLTPMDAAALPSRLHHLEAMLRAPLSRAGRSREAEAARSGLDRHAGISSPARRSCSCRPRAGRRVRRHPRGDAPGFVRPRRPPHRRPRPEGQ